MERKMSNEAKKAAAEYHRNYKSKMSDEARQAANKAMRNWRRKNPDKIRQYNIDYWERKANKGQTIEGRVIHFHELGYSLREIAREVSISHMRVRRILQSVTGSVTDSVTTDK